jgi:predicted dehydrogenase
MTTSNSVGLAIIGCGAITRLAHLPAALRSARIDVRALVDVSLQNALDLQREYALDCQVSADLTQVLGDVEGVLIATPNHTHVAVAAVALTRGLPTLIEKPLTTTYADAIHLCELAERHRTFISVGFRSRQWPGVRLLKELLDQGLLGDVRSFSYEVGNTGGWNSVSGYSVQAEQAGGGTLIDAHILDKILYWFGEPCGFTYADDSHGGVEANCKATLRYDRNDAAFSGSFFLSKTMELRNRLEIRTDRYLCHLDEREDAWPRLMPLNQKGFVLEAQSAPTAANPESKKNSFQLQLEEFAGRIRRGTPITVDGRFAAESVRWTEAMYRFRQSLEEAWATLPPGPTVTGHVA